MTRSVTSFVLAVVLAVLCVSCQPANGIQARLDRISAYAFAANVAIQVAPVPDDVKVWVNAVNTAAQKSVAELKLNESDAVKYANISAYWMPVTNLAITTNGLSPEVAVAIVGTQVAVQIFLTELAQQLPSNETVDAALKDVERNVKVISKSAK